MIDRINFRCLNELLLLHKYFIVSYATFQERVLSNRLRTARDFFLENEDYHLLNAMQNEKAFFESRYIYICIYQGKRLFIEKSEFYSKAEYEAIFKAVGIKLSKEEIKNLIKIANGH